MLLRLDLPQFFFQVVVVARLVVLTFVFNQPLLNVLDQLHVLGDIGQALRKRYCRPRAARLSPRHLEIAARALAVAVVETGR